MKAEIQGEYIHILPENDAEVLALRYLTREPEKDGGFCPHCGGNQSLLHTFIIHGETLENAKKRSQ